MVDAHPLADLLVLGQGDNGLHVVVGELGHGDALVSAGDVISKDDGGEHGEAIGGVERAVIIVVIDPRQLLPRTQTHGGEQQPSALDAAQLFFIFCGSQFHLRACSCPPSQPAGWHPWSVGGGRRQPCRGFPGW